MLRHATFWNTLAGTLILAIVSATPIMMSSIMDRGYEVAKLALAEPLALLALASILMAKGWRRQGAGSGEARVATLCFLAFLLLAGISTLLSAQPAVAFFGGYFRREGLLAWTAYAAFFIAVLRWTPGRSRSGVIEIVELLLLASVIPAAYAIQQRLGLDFFFVGNRDPGRPNGTLGNPVFLGAYFAVLLPVAVVRCWLGRHRLAELALWLPIILLQATGLLISQSRGPLLALVLGLGLLAVLAAGFRRSRGTFVAIGVLLVAVIAMLVLINANVTAQRVARDLPVLGRLIYNLEGSQPGTATSLASRSTAARLGIWKAATETYVAAPTSAKLFGFGPESAYTHYYPHLPDEVMQVDGYWQSNSYDRFHADTLDIALNYGIFGWLAYFGLFSAVLIAAARALFGVGGRWLYLAFTLIPLAVAAIAAGLARFVGLPSTMVPAVGIGVGGGWLLVLAAFAWRASRNGLPESLRSRPELWMLLAALTSSLLVFWIDVQVNIPTLTSRLISFGIAALVLAVASGLSNPAGEESPVLATTPSWAVVFPIIAACASFLPAVALDASMRAQETERWWLSGIPIGSLLALGALHAWIRSAADSGRPAHVLRWTTIVTGFAAAYAMLHWLLVPNVGPLVDPQNVARLTGIAGVGGLFILLISVAAAVTAWRQGRMTAEPKISIRSMFVALPAFVLAGLAGFFALTALKADIGSTVGNWAANKQPDVSDRILLATIAAMPHERHYQRQRTFDLLARAMEEVKHSSSAENFPKIRGLLDQAEDQAREAMRRFPADPWIVLAVANVMQIRALSAIRPFAPEDGGKAALEADELFARAYEIFPNQPLLLRNWAQLRFNEGDNRSAFRLLDHMEAAIPNEIEPYSERVIMAKQINDMDTVNETIERARQRLDENGIQRLLAVVGIQQK
ncbi:O-antigen ligase family protein [Sulfuritalea sp.]|uniref:O-antigen ligase family protein n=1 Tax=Sulfuritalea sp. TaxID=2480090 RepID=UPI001ACFE883|nr:O-antigen ligase family protein [Sulfuritalea sp.]MBN8474956.1 O-antigen ligase family protein [Sulfuritalea sp.]